jgi:hypothetical protein
VFTWKPSDTKGNPREVVDHKLNINPVSKLVKQRCKAIGEEILKLLSVGFIREVYHPE